MVFLYYSSVMQLEVDGGLQKSIVCDKLTFKSAQATQWDNLINYRVDT